MMPAAMSQSVPPGIFLNTVYLLLSEHEGSVSIGFFRPFGDSPCFHSPGLILLLPPKAAAFHRPVFHNRK